MKKKTFWEDIAEIFKDNSLKNIKAEVHKCQTNTFGKMKKELFLR